MRLSGENVAALFVENAGNRRHRSLPIQAVLSRAAIELRMRLQDGVIKFIFVEAN
jgi:hypothetical protein